MFCDNRFRYNFELFEVGLILQIEPANKCLLLSSAVFYYQSNVSPFQNFSQNKFPFLAFQKIQNFIFIYKFIFSPFFSLISDLLTSAKRSSLVEQALTYCNIYHYIFQQLKYLTLFVLSVRFCYDPFLLSNLFSV